MKRLLSMALLPMILGGCAATLPAEVSGLGDPADSASELRGMQYRSPISGYTHREPTGPKPWGPLNDAQSTAKEDAS
ncbi:hypothetical protein [Sinorhizobium sp. Sb3]|uniref:hypothetical protein n=1 Tax=Sinorhizobium/Ensifer group TaxID=227292 RepID=UPI00071CA85E|nr:hypothetical protein [Sinorhizobium sp. Sb3]